MARKPRHARRQVAPGHPGALQSQGWEIASVNVAALGIEIELALRCIVGGFPGTINPTPGAPVTGTDGITLFAGGIDFPIAGLQIDNGGYLNGTLALDPSPGDVIRIAAATTQPAVGGILIQSTLYEL